MPTGYNQKLVTRADEFVSFFLGYQANSLGQIRSSYTKEILAHEIVDGVRCVKTGWLFTRFSRCSARGYIPVAEIVAANFKSSNLPLSYLLQCMALPKDGDDLNFHPSNLVWKFPQGGLPVGHAIGFYYIPGYTQYAINRDGVVLHVETGCVKQPYEQMGALVVSAARDGQLTGPCVNIYRLLALTFLDYPLNAEEMVVNHKDGDRMNLVVDNLEWITQLENIRHGVIRKRLGRIPPRFTYVTSEYDAEATARLLNLSEKESVNLTASIHAEIIKRQCKRSYTQHKRGVRIQRLNVHTKEIVMFNTRGEAISNTQILDNQLYQSLMASGGNGSIGIVKSTYVFRYEGDEFPEITEDVLHNHLRFGGSPRATVIKNVDTGEIKEYESAAALCRETGLSKKVVTSRLARNEQCLPNSCFRVQYKDSLRPWI